MRDLYLKTVSPRGETHGGFIWPLEVGAEVEATDWNPKPVCGGGLHGLRRGEGGGFLLDKSSKALWLVFSAEDADAVDLGGKAKVRRARVEHVGDRESAAQFLFRNCPGAAVCWITLTGGDRSTLTGGHGSTLTGGDWSTLTGGNYSTLTGGDDSRLTGGIYSTLTGGNYSTLTGGHGSTLTGGDYSTLIIQRIDGRRRRVFTAYVGEDGIEAHVAYRLSEDGRFVRA